MTIGHLLRWYRRHSREIRGFGQFEVSYDDGSGTAYSCGETLAAFVQRHSLYPQRDPLVMEEKDGWWTAMYSVQIYRGERRVAVEYDKLELRPPEQ